MPYPDEPTTGRIRAISNRLYDWTIDFLDEYGYDEHTVSLNPDLDITQVRDMPCFTIKAYDARYEREPYGRRFNGNNKGIWAYYPFTVFIYHWRNELDDPEISHNYDLHILVDRYLAYLHSKNRDVVERTVHNIVGVEDLTARESDPIGVRNLVRMIVSGTVKAIRMDSS